MSDFPNYDKHYALLRQWSEAITREEARNLLDAALGDEPLYRLDNSEPKKTYSEETIGAFVHTTLGYVRTGVLVRVWPKEER